MNEIILKELRLLNFKGLHEQTFTFHAGETRISGRNGVGKSTVFDAFSWLLFGKNAAGAKVFSLKTMDADGHVIPRLPHEVAATLTKNGEEVHLRRCLTEKWQKKRGEAEEKYTGNTEERYWNDVPCTATEYDAKVSELCPESLFRTITTPGFFLAYPADKQRQLLFEMAGDVTDSDVANTRQDFADLLTQMSGKNFEEFRRELAAKKRRIKESLETIPGRIDERKRDMETAEPMDTENIQEGLDHLNDEVKRLDDQIADRSRATEAATAQRELQVKELSALRTRAYDREQQVRLAAKAEYFSLLTQRQALMQELNTARASMQGLNIRQQHDQQHIDQLQSRREALLAEYRTLSDAIRAADAPMTEADFCCPTCGRRFEPDEIEAKRHDLTLRYVEGLMQQRDDNRNRGLQLRADLEAARADLEAATRQEQDVAATIARLEEEPLLRQEPTEPTGEAEVAADEELKDLGAQIAALEADIVQEVQTADVEELRQRRQTLRANVASLQDRLSRARVIDESLKKNRKRIDELEAQQRSQSDQLTQLELTEYRMQEFSKARTRMMEDKVNGLFNLVRYKLFDRQINGAEVECCIPMVNGVPYADVNSAGRINAGLDVINTLSRIHGWRAPIFIDNAESVNQLMPTRSQVVKLIVTQTDGLTVSSAPESEVELFD